MDAVAPDLVLRYLRELSADQLGSAVLDANGAVLAGSGAVGEAARELLEAAPSGARAIAATGPAGCVFAARDGAHAVIVACTAHALEGLVLHDLRAALGSLAGGPSAEPEDPLRASTGDAAAPSSGLAAAAQRVLSAAQSRPRP